MIKSLNLSRSLKVLSLKAEIDRYLLLSVCFSLLMLAARVVCTHSLTSVWLSWNLFLAWLPYGLSRWMYHHTASLRNRWVLAGLAVCWLLFIPNSFYIITDLFHLHEERNAPLWFDVLLIFSFAWNGLLMGILSVRDMEKIMQAFFTFRNEFLFLYPVMWLNALGVYIGRYLRYNSWDVIASPFSLTRDMITLLIHPIFHKQEWAMVFCFSFFMTLMYITVKKTSRVMW